MKIKSIFEQISEQVFVMTNLEQAKTFITDFVTTKNINEKDKTSILNEVSKIKNMFKLQQYLCNALLKYEGLSLNKQSTEREVYNPLGE